MRIKQFLFVFLFLFISKSTFANKLELQKFLQCQNDNIDVLDQFQNPKLVFDGEMVDYYRVADGETKIFGSSIRYIEFSDGENIGVHYTLLETKSFSQPLRHAEKIFNNKRQSQEILFEELKQGKHEIEYIQRRLNGYEIRTDNRTVSFFKVNGFVAVRCD